MDLYIYIYIYIRYLVSFGPERYNAIYDRIRYIISEKSGIRYSIYHNFAIIRTDSYHSLPTEKTFTFHNVIILIKSVFNKNKNEYYYNIFLGKGSNENKSYTEFFKLIFVHYKCYISIELTFLKEMLIMQVNQKNEYLSLLAFFI